jgi:outer membrane biogenesis lipoprotein LolB
MVPEKMKFACVASLAFALTACSSVTSKQPERTDNSSQAQQAQTTKEVPVFIIPNCQKIGQQSYCNWIEPPRMTHPEEVDSHTSQPSITL